jgi:phosphate transport system protein
MKRFFDNELVTFRTHISRMLTLTHQQSRLAVEALLERDKSKSLRVLEIEKEVDQLEIEVDAEAVRYLNMRAPVASELRLIMAGVKMSHEFERIGDEAKKIAKRAKRTENLHPAVFVESVTAMFACINEIFESMQIMFSEGNARDWETLIARDQEIDDLNKSLQQQLMLLIESKDVAIKGGFDLIFVSRGLERIGDHVQNLVQTMVFLITGNDIR